MEEAILNVHRLGLLVDSSPSHYVPIITWEISSENFPTERSQPVCLGECIIR